MNISVPELLKDTIDKRFYSEFFPNEENAIFIREEQQDAKCRWVEIKLKNSISSFCFSIDVPRKTGELDPIFPFFNVEKAEICSKNDAILVCQKEQKIYVLLIELKSTTKGSYLKQMKSSEILFNFIVDRINLVQPTAIKKEQLVFKGILFWCPRYMDEGITRKKNKTEFEDRNGLLVTEQLCHNTYHIQQFLR